MLKINITPINDLLVIDVDQHFDSRGAFARLFCQRELEAYLGGKSIVQINYSRTLKAGSIRGLHFQKPPYSEIKFIRCIKGSVWDVAVDLRANSSTFLHWHAEVLSDKNMSTMLIPEGFAHGFQALENGSELLYLHSNYYSPDAEDGLRYDDPALDIVWPFEIKDLSIRDLNFPLIDAAYKGILL